MTAATHPTSPDRDPGPPRARVRGATPWLVAAAVVGAVIIGSLVAADRFGDDEAEVQAPAPATATLTRRDLTETASWDGTLGYAESGDLTHRADPVVSTATSGAGRNAQTITTETPAQGVLTFLAPQASIVEAGEVLYRVDDVPVILLDGEIPLWRTLDTDTGGSDVEAVETALVDMGYDPDGTVTVDTAFTSYTAAMVERFQADVGQPVTGVLELGRVVMRPGPVRVGEHLVTEGSVLVDGTAVFVTSAADREASFSIDPASRGLVSVGDAVEVRLPDRSVVAAMVASISPTVDAETGVYVGRLSVPEDGGYSSDQLDVTVLASVTLIEDALTVAPDALMALEGGRYQVRVVNGSGVEPVRVELLAEADRFVAITADGLDDGTIVLTP